MRPYHLFFLVLLTGCEPEVVYLEREIPAEFTTPCPEPVKGPASEGAFAEYAIGWKHTAQCNGDKLESIRTLVSGHNNPQ